ncbi:MAG: hypothetical protein QOH57_4918, partial [Mycobacterium sp.]|nr:hypothetical protein [Mycobacterium sp.]
MADKPVLELRIHGINNTKPADMLDLPAEDIEMFAGDALGSFWRPKSPSPDSPTHLEAYSWGGMARSSVGGPKGISRLLGGVARIGWALLIPFGLVNVAYWSRKFDDGPVPRPRSFRDGLGHGRKAASLRIAGLMLTLLMAVSASTVVLDLVAVQCYKPGSNQLLCTSLPSQLDFLGTMSQTRRLALLSVFPVALIIGLGLLSQATRVRYEQPDPATPASVTQAEASTAHAEWPILSTDGFWAHREITKVTSRMHVAATAALVAGGTAFHVAFGRGQSCGSREKYFSKACLSQVLSGGWQITAELVVVGLGLLILATTIAIVAIRADYAIDVPRMAPQTKNLRNRLVLWGPLAASVLLFIGQAVLLAWDQPQPQASQLLGISFTPTWLLAGLVGFGLAGLLWRPSIGTRWWFLPAVLGLGVVGLVMISGYANTIHLWWTAWAVAAGIAMCVLLTLRHRTAAQRESEAWGGSGPGVLLLVATAFAVLLSSAVVTVAGDWLNGNQSAAELANAIPERVPTPDPCPS